MSRGNLLGLNREELENLAASFGQPRYRGRQIYRGIYVRRVREFAGLTDLDRDFRAALASRHAILYPQVEREFRSRDGAVRYLFRLADGAIIAGGTTVRCVDPNPAELLCWRAWRPPRNAILNSRAPF